MNDRIKQMLAAAGFMMWDGEAWAPKGAVVDWNADYTVELTTFIHNLICQAARVAATAEGEFNNEVYYAVFDHFVTPDNHNNDFTPYEPTEIDEWCSYDKDC
jgi:hypothetical protein